jgi:hypothetical protein
MFEAAWHIVALVFIVSILFQVYLFKKTKGKSHMMLHPEIWEATHVTYFVLRTWLSAVVN